MIDKTPAVETMNEENFIALVGGIIKQAVSDLEKPVYAKDALAFLTSEYFEIICGWVNLSPSAVRKLAGLKEK